MIIYGGISFTKYYYNATFLLKASSCSMLCKRLQYDHFTIVLAFKDMLSIPSAPSNMIMFEKE